VAPKQPREVLHNAGDGCRDGFVWNQESVAEGHDEGAARAAAPSSHFYQRRSCSTAVKDVREPAEKLVAMIAVVVPDHMMTIFVSLRASLQSSERKHTDSSRRGQHEDCSAHC